MDRLGMIPVRRWLERAAAEGRVRVVTATSHAGLWYRDVWDQSSAGIAERTLLHSLKGEAEGFVDRYFNRTFSRLLTSAFLWMKCSPNTITMIATAVGLLSALGFGWGTYEAGIIAALLFQLAAIIDCCDGEVARLTFTESPFGAWLDIAMDNVVHMAIFAGIACGAYLRQVGTDGDWVPARARRGCGIGQCDVVLVGHEGAKNRHHARLEYTQAGSLVRFHSEECGEPRFLRGGVPLRDIGQARLVFVDGRAWLNGVLVVDGVGHSTFGTRPCLKQPSFSSGR